MDILDTGTDSQTRFLDSRNYGINILKNTDIDLEKQKRAANSLACGESEEEDLSGVGMRVCFKDIEYIVRNIANKKEKISLLKGVSGILFPGLMTALIGPSGSGKTTLLDVLAARKTLGTVKGHILFAGRRASRQFLQRYTGYVEQFDTLLDNLTVYEQLLYTSELKNSQKESLAKKKARVEVVLSQLSMESCKNVTIGSAMKRGISGGQCKRTNIGIALVTNPRVLFLDEPTSGLDSYTSNEVMSVVRTLTKEGMTIVATIHSPTPYCFNLFDRLMILIGGHAIYHGPNGLPAVHFFEETNPDIPRYGTSDSENDNPAEWIVNLTTQADREGRRLELAEKFEGSLTYLDGQMLVDAEMMNTKGANSEMLKELKTKRATSTSFFFALKTILKYRMAKDYTDFKYVYPRTMDKLSIALIVMTLYWKAGKKLRIKYPELDIVDRTVQFQSASNIGVGFHIGYGKLVFS